MNPSSNSTMRFSYSFLVVLMVLLAMTKPRLVNCRVLQSPIKTEMVIHEPLKELKFSMTSVAKEKTNTEDNKSGRVLIENQFHTTASGPSRRGSGH